MNIRKNIDYSEMYAEIDTLMAKELLQMELYCGIGKAVCRRTEKGAAVMASEYLNKQYPDVKGFSPRSLRRMRDFYRTYENHPALLSRAMQLGWIQNVVIMEADLTMELREWYMMAVLELGWSKAVLNIQIYEKAHENLILRDKKTETSLRNKNSNRKNAKLIVVMLKFQFNQLRQQYKSLIPKEHIKRCYFIGSLRFPKVAQILKYDFDLTFRDFCLSLHMLLRYNI